MDILIYHDIMSVLPTDPVSMSFEPEAIEEVKLAGEVTPALPSIV